MKLKEKIAIFFGTLAILIMSIIEIKQAWYNMDLLRDNVIFHTIFSMILFIGFVLVSTKLAIKEEGEWKDQNKKTRCAKIIKEKIKDERKCEKT
ncbi:hypothetical protein LCGC14_0373980 [marine sediment metagenome]|uniref:Uncharacterized protein n=1 Tax=marine sediment metagenome TaxID=412755 RepID=A0A0F9WCS9_9ZZZZ